MTELNQKNSGKNIKWHNLTIDRNKLEKMRGHKGMVIWFTGLSGSGKSTLANAVNEVLHLDGLSTYVLDGDNIRHGLCKDLGFSDEDREENIRRIGEVANLFMNAGIITITAFVSPFINDRNKVRKIIGSKDFIEVYCSADIDVCEIRDTKGLYKKARLGEIKEFTGISSPYEAPVNPEIVVDTGSLNLNDSVKEVINYNPDEIILMPLYPQYSAATSGSSIKEWKDVCLKNNFMQRSRLFIKRQILKAELTRIVDFLSKDQHIKDDQNESFFESYRQTNAYLLLKSCSKFRYFCPVKLRTSVACLRRK